MAEKVENLRSNNKFYSNKMAKEMNKELDQPHENYFCHIYEVKKLQAQLQLECVPGWID